MHTVQRFCVYKTAHKYVFVIVVVAVQDPPRKTGKWLITMSVLYRLMSSLQR